MGVPLMFRGCGPPVLIGFSVYVNASKRHACLPAICNYHGDHAINVRSTCSLRFPLHGPARYVPRRLSPQSLSAGLPFGMRLSVCFSVPYSLLHSCRQSCGCFPRLCFPLSNSRQYVRMMPQVFSLLSCYVPLFCWFVCLLSMPMRKTAGR